MLEARNRAIVEISDDDSAESQPAPATRTQPIHGKSSREVISISSASDADGSDMDVVIMPQLTHKRSRTGGSSLGSSPHTAARISGKRRVAPAGTGAILDASSLQVQPGLLRHPALQGPSMELGNIAPDLGTSRATQRRAKPRQKEKKAEEPPYYVDGRLDVIMYRGPGYERFPVALGTVEGHREICNKWDADLLAKTERKLAKLQRTQHTLCLIDEIEPDSSDDDMAERKATFEKRCFDGVVEVFPDIERAFVQKKIQNAAPQLGRFEDEDLIALGPPPLAETIISEVLEMESYPKERSSNSTASGKGAAGADGTGITISWDRTRPKNDTYLKDATILIAKHFPHVPTHFVDHVVKDKKSIFDAYVTIHDLEDRYYDLQPRPYPRRKQARVELEKKYMLKVSERRIPAEYANRVNELQAAKQSVARETIKDAAKKAKEEAEAANLAEHIESGAIMECLCCYDAETPLNRVVPCTAEVPHNFCFTCVEGLADTQVGLLKYEMLCMDSSGCTATLSHEDVGRAIPITTFDRLELNQQQAEIMAANIEGLEQCPSCDYKAICGELKEEPVFYCQNPECSRASCRSCKKDDHTPLTCAEADTDRILSARHLIEEARSQAIIRTCRKCKAPILKEYGCNKMTCSRCSSLFCYNCNEDITHLTPNPYSHFGTKCVLYDQPQGGDRHEKEANEAEKDAISKAKAMDATLDERKLRIETGKAIDPEARERATQNLLAHPAGGVFIRDLNNQIGRLNPRQLHMQNLQAHVDQLEAMRPDRELGEILAEARAVGGAFNMGGIPPPEVRMQQLQRLQELQRRTQAALAQRQVQIGLPMLDAEGLARRGRQPNRLERRNPGVDAVHEHGPFPVVNPGVNPVPNLMAPYPGDHVVQAGWAEVAQLQRQYRQVDFNFGAPQGIMPQAPVIAPDQGVAQDAAAALATGRVQRRALLAQAAAQRLASQTQFNAGQLAPETVEQGQGQLAAGGFELNRNNPINLNGAQFPAGPGGPARGAPPPPFGF